MHKVIIIAPAEMRAGHADEMNAFKISSYQFQMTWNSKYFQCNQINCVNNECLDKMNLTFYLPRTYQHL